MIRFQTVNRWYKEIFGRRVQRLPVYWPATCPNRNEESGRGGCIYCDESGSAAGDLDFSLSLDQQIQRGMDRIRTRYPDSGILLYFQPFTATYRSLEPLSRVIPEAIHNPDIVGVSLGTRPDCMDEYWLEYLSSLNRETYLEMDMGLQSACNRTLEIIRRGHTVEQYNEAVFRFSERKIRVVSHVILGLPGEGPDEFKFTAKHLSRLPIHGIKIHSLYLMASSPLAGLYGLDPSRALEGGECFASPDLPDLNVLTLENYAKSLYSFLNNLSNGIVLYRFTGEGSSPDLIGPEWVKLKRRSRSYILEYLEKRGIGLD